MNAAPQSAAGAALASSHAQQTGWCAQLQLGFARRGQRTVLVRRNHLGPLLVQKALYPEGDAVCHAIVVHPPGGVAGGDRLSLQVEVEAGAHALLTTPGAGKWYKAGAEAASQALDFSVAQAGALEWLPQETILFDAADARWRTQVALAPDARYAGWEILCLGRAAAGERFERGRLRQQTRVQRAGRCLWNEQAALRGGDPLLQSPIGMQGRTVTATFIVANGAAPPELLEQCRALAPADGAGYGVTALPDIFAARYLGDSAQCARGYFERLWALLRPWYARLPAQRPRIWST